jgi:ABC-type uncharacterized transport system involved in gliding motility auxiliary subunit
VLKRILGLIGWLGVALVLAAVALRFLAPERQQLINYLAIGGLVATLLYLLSQWRDIVRSFSQRNVQYGSLAIGSVLLVLGILVAVNWISTRQNKRWDLTANKQYSLSEQTRKVLGDLQQPVAVRVFDESAGFIRFRDVLSEYEYGSKHFTVEYVDIVKQPTQAQRFQVAQPGTIVLEYGGRTERVTSTDEQQLTNALIKVVSGRQPKVYFVHGHGERDTTGSDRDGYAAAAEQLRGSNFLVERLPLAQDPNVPADADIVVVAGPEADYLPAEIDALQAYLRRGGHVLMLLDPPATVDAKPLTNLIAFAREWGIDVGTNVVVDVSGVGRAFNAGPEVPIALSYPGHPINDRFDQMTAFSLARSVMPVEGGANGRYAQPFVETGPNSWAESDLRALMTRSEVRRDPEAGDIDGPVSLGAAVSAAAEAPPAQPEPAEGEAPADDDAPKPEARLAVIGDSDFAANWLVGFQGNRDFFLNVVNWLALQENLIAIRPKSPDDRRITMTADQQTRVRWITLFVIPGLLFAAGVHTWWRRR